MVNQAFRAFLVYAKDASKKAAVSLFVAAGVLAIANVDSVWRGPQGPEYTQIKQEARKTLSARLPAATENRGSGASEVSMIERLSGALSQDELGEQNPFANLSNLDPLNQIFSRGVLNFQRQAYRSPEYQEEIGYDLLSYDIEQKDHSHTTILAYLERSLTDGPANQEAKRSAVVLMIENRAGLAHQSLYKDGDLLEQSDLPLSQAQALVSQKLNSGVPFFSVAR